MTTVLTPDICVIGGGMAGIAVAEAAAAMGVPVVLVERGRMGGAGLYHGALALRALGEAARHAQTVREARGFGVNASLTRVDFPAVMEHVRRTVESATLDYTAPRLRALGVTVIEAMGRFSDRRTLEAGGFTIQPRRFVVATGARPLVPAIDGLDTLPCLTPQSLFALEARPEHLVILAGEPRALEAAQAFRRLGSKVTVIEIADPLRAFDPELAEVTRTALAREGIALRPARALRAERTEKGVRLMLEGKDGATTVSGTHVLLALGQAADVDGLAIEKARIRLRDGHIAVNSHCRTRNGRIYAVGAATGADEEALAAAQAMTVLRHALFRAAPALQTHHAPRLLWTAPALAQIGWTEAEARARAKAIRVLRWPYAASPAALAMRRMEGHIKIITCARDRVLGVSIAGEGAGEMIAGWSGLVQRRASVAEAAMWITPRPALADIGRRAALGHIQRHLTKPWLGRIIRFLRNFG